MQVIPPVSKREWVDLNEGRATDSQFVAKMQAAINKWATSFTSDDNEMVNGLRAVIRSALSSRRRDFQTVHEHHKYLRMIRFSTEVLFVGPMSHLRERVQQERDNLESAALLLYHACINDQFDLDLSLGLEQCGQGNELPFCVADYLSPS